MAKTKPYRKIRAASGSGLVAQNSLWVGADHLLAVANTHGMENYKRYYFAEIQALVAHRTTAWRMGNFLLGLVAALLLVPGVISHVQGEAEAAVTLFVLGGVVFVVFAWHLLEGPTAKLFVQTATSYDRLEGVSRWRRARKVIARIEPIVREAQRHLAQPAPSAQPAPVETPAAAQDPAAGPAETVPPA